MHPNAGSVRGRSCRTLWADGHRLGSLARAGATAYSKGTGNIIPHMRAFYDARVEDLRAGDYVITECASCGNTQLLTKPTLQRHGAPSHERIMEPKGRLRCRQCDERGRVTLLIKWAR
jgi:hypothetical protein